MHFLQTHGVGGKYWKNYNLETHPKVLNMHAPCIFWSVWICESLWSQTDSFVPAIMKMRGQGSWSCCWASMQTGALSRSPGWSALTFCAGCLDGHHFPQVKTQAYCFVSQILSSRKFHVSILITFPRPHQPLRKANPFGLVEASFTIEPIICGLGRGCVNGA